MVHKVRMTDLMDKNREAGEYWFSEKTMAFFKSHVGGTAYQKGDNAYFISSEKAPHNPRKFTIRVMDMKSGSVSTVGDFGEFSTQKRAEKRMMEIVG